MSKYCISVSRQFGSLGRPVAKLLAEKLGVNFYDRDIVEVAAEKQGIPLHEASRMEESASRFAFMKFPLGLGTTEAQDRLFQVESKLIREIAERESCVIVGRCSDSILEDFDNHLSIFVYAPYEDRIVNCVNELGMDPKHARKMIADVDKARDAYHMRYVKYLPNDMNHIDLMINSAMFGIEGTAEFLSDLVRKKYGV